MAFCVRQINVNRIMHDGHSPDMRLGRRRHDLDAQHSKTEAVRQKLTPRAWVSVKFALDADNDTSSCHEGMGRATPQIQRRSLIMRIQHA